MARLPGCRHTPSDFNYDFNVSFKPEQIWHRETRDYNFRQTNPGVEDLSGTSIFYKRRCGPNLLNTYSCYARGR